MDGLFNDEDQEPKRTILKNEMPQTILSVFSTGLDLLQQYGWLLLLTLIALLYIKNKFIQPKLQQWQQHQEEAKYKKTDTGLARDKAEALERARQRMQEELDRQAAEYKLRQQQKEEKAREEKIADWEKHQEGKGYRSKYRPKDEPAQGNLPKPKPKPKKPLRDNEYSPLMGSSSDSCFRPGRRGASGGG